MAPEEPWQALGLGDSSHSRCRTATAPFQFPKYVNTHNAISCLRQSRWCPKTDGETEAPREDKLATEPRMMSFCWAGRLVGTARQPTCIPQWLGPGSPDTLGRMLCPTLSSSAQGHVSWLENTDSKPPACLCWGKHGCLGTGMSTTSQ